MLTYKLLFIFYITTNILLFLHLVVSIINTIKNLKK